MSTIVLGDVKIDLHHINLFSGRYIDLCLISINCSKYNVAFKILATFKTLIIYMEIQLEKQKRVENYII